MKRNQRIKLQINLETFQDYLDDLSSGLEQVADSTDFETLEASLKLASSQLVALSLIVEEELNRLRDVEAARINKAVEAELKGRRTDA